MSRFRPTSTHCQDRNEADAAVAILTSKFKSREIISLKRRRRQLRDHLLDIQFIRQLIGRSR